MRETLAAALVAALLGVGCEGKTDVSAPAAPQPAARAVEQAALDLKPAATPAENPRPQRKHKKALRVARASKPMKVASRTDRRVQQTDVGDPSAPTLRLYQSRPSSY